MKAMVVSLVHELSKIKIINNYMEYCLSSNCGSCDMPLLFTPLSGTLSYGTYTINAAAMGNLLKQVNLGAGSYNIKMTA